MERAIFAGGCFWCMVEPFEEKPGILSITSGYTGGHLEDPSYEEVKAGGTGHTEAVEIVFDSDQISYFELLDIYWRQTDPTDALGQFSDRGDSYRPVIFYSNSQQKEAAQRSKADLEASGRFSDPIVTQIQPASTFYPAEDYHQDFHKKSRDSYLADESTQARKAFIEDHWKN